MSTYVILDLDNTIADDAWRIPSINWQWSNPAPSPASPPVTIMLLIFLFPFRVK